MRSISYIFILLSVIQILHVSSYRIKRQNRFADRQWNNFNQFDQNDNQDEVFEFDQNSFQQQQNQNTNQPNQQQTTTKQAPSTGSLSRAFLSCMGGCQALSHYNPICGSDGQTYHNDQRLGCAQRCGADVRQTSIGACPNPNAG